MPHNQRKLWASVKAVGLLVLVIIFGRALREISINSGNAIVPVVVFIVMAILLIFITVMVMGDDRDQ